MAIRREHDAGAIDAALARALEAWQRAVARQLCYVGEAAVAAARREGSYTDQTGNLRASIGYVVLYADGAEAGSGGFHGAGQGGGKEYALRLAREALQGPVLVVTAGMRYARYVAARGYDVLDSAELVARDLARRLAAGG